MSNYQSIIGFIGAALILVGYWQVSRGIWQGKGKAFQLVNLLGSALLVWYSLLLAAYPVVVLNAVWLVVAVVALSRAILRRTS